MKREEGKKGREREKGLKGGSRGEKEREKEEGKDRKREGKRERIRQGGREKGREKRKGRDFYLIGTDKLSSLTNRPKSKISSKSNRNLSIWGKLDFEDDRHW